MKFGFVTCVQLGLSCMEAIYEIGGELDLVITLEDSQAADKSGRVYLDKFCKTKNIHLFKSSHINNEVCEKIIKEYKIDWLFIIGWSQIAKPHILNAPVNGTLGIHPTLLPQGRGRAPIPWAIIKGLRETGVTLFKLDEGVDTGDIVEQLIIPLSDSITATELYDQVNLSQTNLIQNTFLKLKNNSVKLKVQDNSKATEWPGRTPEDGEIDLSGSVYDAEKLIRAVTKPYPGAFVILDNKEFKIWSARFVQEKSSGFVLEFHDGILECLEWE